MKPGLDRQNSRDPWPNPLDTPLDRARKIAGMYRAHLRVANPTVCDELDDTAAGYGEDWMLNKPDIVDPDRELTTSEAAALVHVHPDTIRKWACQWHPVQPDPRNPSWRLLPRFKMRGRERTYLARHVLEAAAIVGRARHARTRILR